MLPQNIPLKRSFHKLLSGYLNKLGIIAGIEGFKNSFTRSEVARVFLSRPFVFQQTRGSHHVLHGNGDVACFSNRYSHGTFKAHSHERQTAGRVAP